LNYAEVLPDVNYTPSRAGEHLTQAGALEGKAKAMDVQSDAQLGLFLGTTAIEAGKGYLKSEESKEIKSDLDKLEDFGDGAKAAAQVPQREANIVEAVGTFMGAAPNSPEVGMMMADAKRHVEAAKQGILTKDEVITRVAATVKKYSAMMPGWASDFRKVAAELTGIANIETLQIHNALTQKSAREKQAERIAQANIEFQKQVSTAVGEPIEALTPAHYNLYRVSQQGKIARERLDNEIKMKNLVQEDADQAYGQMVSLDIATGVSDLMLDFGKVWSLNSDPKKFIDSQQAGLELSAKIGILHHRLAQNIRSMTTPRGDRPAMSAKEADARLSRLDTDMKNYQEMVKTAEGRNMFLSIAKHANTSAEMMMNNFMLANPHVAQLSKLGVFPPLFQARVTLDKKEFEARFGKRLGDTMEALMNPTSQTQYAGVFGGMVSGTGPTPADTARVDPKLGEVQMRDGVEFLKNSDNLKPDPESQDKFANTLSSVVRSLRYGFETDLKAFNELVSSPARKEYISSMPSEVRAKALAPALPELQIAAVNAMQSVTEALDKYNNSKELNVLAGWRLEAVLDPVTERVRIQEVRAGQSALPPELRRMGVRGGEKFPTRTRFNEASDAATTANKAAARLNQALEAYGSAASLVSGKPFALDDLRSRAYEGIQNRKTDLVEGAFLIQRQPAETVDPTVLRNMIDALGKAESNGNTKAVGDGGKAVGAWQMHPEAMVDAGFKPEDRNDPEKSRAAATIYFGKKLQEYGGDVVKAISAWNMGSAGFQRHLERHGDLWMMELPDATKGLLKRFKEHLK
jgi:hypothetical protein